MEKGTYQQWTLVLLVPAFSCSSDRHCLPLCFYLYLTPLQPSSFIPPFFRFLSCFSPGSLTMKQGLVLLFLLLVCYQYAARATRPLKHQYLEEEVKGSGFSDMGHWGAGEDDAWTAGGLEGCENEDDECLKRRMISEAHLDYIYTQHHKP